jgi:hypothetical protein
LLRIVLILGFVALALGSVNAHAAPCAGFTDVDSASTFCPNVDWLKNRQITLGCTGTTYCPNDYVTRLQMAAFMNRLGVVFTPMVLSVQQAVANPTGNQVICITADVPITDYRRFASAISTASFSLPASDIIVGARNVFSTDGGQNWQSFDATNANLDRVHNLLHVGGVTSVTALGPERAIFGATFRFGVQLIVFAATPITDAWCQLRATITNRNGTNSPY